MPYVKWQTYCFSLSMLSMKICSSVWEFPVSKEGGLWSTDMEISYSNIADRRSLKTENCHYANFVVTGGTGSCNCDNLQCDQWWQTKLASWQLSGILTNSAPHVKAGIITTLGFQCKASLPICVISVNLTPWGALNQWQITVNPGALSTYLPCSLLTSNCRFPVMGNLINWQDLIET